MPDLVGKTSENWNKIPYRWSRRRSAPVADLHPPWPEIRDDGRVLEVVDPVAAMEALQSRKKKQYEEDRLKRSNVAVIGRCPFKGASYHKSGGRRSKSFNNVSPILFTIPNFLTREECKGFISAAEARGFHYQTSEQNLGPCGGAKFIQSHQNLVPGYARDEVPFSRCNSYTTCPNEYWTPGLKAVFESIRVQGKEGAPAIGCPMWSTYITRYEKGERCEPHSNLLHTYYKPLYKYKRGLIFQGVSHDLYTVQGYDILVYLNGSQEINTDRAVAGGETVFYSQQYHNGNLRKPIAKVAPETGMAVCIARGAHGPSFEIRPVTKGVVYMIELVVQFSNFISDGGYL